ncbi:MAG: efflux RND transporter periplasmic adaptor subunit [Kiritimatiellae bacterium]|nr:efflux RND transporter periplasmic adaptor subunit [Kiritimatiellia bacterium]
MHPQIQQPGPGPCPLCGMDLVPVTDQGDDEELGPRELKLSAKAEKLAEVAVVPVEQRFVTSEVRMVGKVEYDETRLAYLTAWVPGRLDRLYVDYTGVPVQKGDHMVYLYSPELLAAQEELIQALATAKQIGKSDVSIIKERTLKTVDATREKLRLLGLTSEQIQEIEQNEKPKDHLTIYSPISGTVIHKNAQEGMYVKTGTRIYTIADLSHVWVKLDAYESDLTWIHYGQNISFETEAYPGELFHGRIAFIDPILDPKTRTVKVRVNVDNSNESLKPGMFVRAVVQSQVVQGGKTFSPELAGKWISPMHPEIIKDKPGACDICGMPLVKAESLGYVPAESRKAPLVIPASAPLLTGKRAVVYVKDPNRKGIYEGREVLLGPRAGHHYIVEEGLQAGELVVVKGTFKIDSAMQIMAKPSMMTTAAPEGRGVGERGKENL